MSTFDERARARASWPVRVYALGTEPLADTRDHSTVDERVRLVWTLTLEAWAERREPIPSYARHEAPGRVIDR